MSDYRNEDGELVAFAKVAVGFHRNPKLRSAHRDARDARDVYVWLLCQVAEAGTEGTLSIRLIAADHLAWAIGDVTEDDMSNAVTALVTHDLITIDTVNDVVSITGWEPIWGRTKTASAAKQAAYRKRKSSKSYDSYALEQTRDADTTTNSNSVTDVESRVTVCYPEEKRREEKKKEKRQRKTAAPSIQSDWIETESEATTDPAKPVPPFRKVSDAYTRHYMANNEGRKPTWGTPDRPSRLPKQIKNLLELTGNDADEIVRRMDIMFTAPPSWMDPPHDLQTLYSNYDKLASPSQPKAAVGRREVARPSAPSEAL